ncbi:MAG: tyrosine-type recombinase/integrase [Dehalococcoidia bacterium]
MSKAYLDPNEIRQLEDAATNLRDKLLIRVLFRLGCRISEALAITIDDIDFKRGTINIIHLKRRVKLSCEKCGANLGLSHLYCPKCGTKTNVDS